MQINMLARTHRGVLRGVREVRLAHGEAAVDRVVVRVVGCVDGKVRHFLSLILLGLAAILSM